MSRKRRTALRIGLAGLSAAVLALLFWNALSQVLSVLALSAVLAFLLVPLCARFEHFLSPGPSALLSVLLAVGALLTFAALALPSLVRQLGAIAEQLGEIGNYLQETYMALQSRCVPYGIRLPDPSDLFDLGGLYSGTVAMAGSLAGGAYKLSLAATLCCFFLADRRRLLLGLELLIPSRLRRQWVGIGNAVRREMYLYIRGQALVSFSVGALSILGLLLAGIPSAPALGAFVGVMDLIPYFGPVLGAVPAVLIALRIDVMSALLAACVIALVQQIDGMFISPRIMGGLTGFSPAAVLLAIFAGSALCGVVGMLAALPAAMVLRTIYRCLTENRLKKKKNAYPSHIFLASFPPHTIFPSESVV